MELTYSASFKFVLDELRRYDPQGILLNSGTQISGSHKGTDYSLMNRYTEHLNAYYGGNQLDFHRNFNPDLTLCQSGRIFRSALRRCEERASADW